MDKDKVLWEKAAEFHGHECGGLTIGYKAVLYAAELLGLTLTEEDQVFCVAENNSCSVDAFRALLGCTQENRNLVFNLTGKQAFTVDNQKTGQSIRLVLKEGPAGMTREESFGYFQSCEPKDMFTVEEL